MSGRLIELTGGKVPQRAVRHLGSLPFTSAIKLDALDFGAGDTGTFVMPGNRRGKILAMEISGVSEAFTADTTGAIIQVGDGVDADAHAFTGEFGTIAIGARDDAYVADASITAGVEDIIEAGETVTVTAVAPTGGVPAGIGDVVLTVYFFE